MSYVSLKVKSVTPSQRVPSSSNRYSRLISLAHTYFSASPVALSAASDMFTAADVMLVLSVTAGSQ